jgi:hypothetical protein
VLLIECERFSRLAMGFTTRKTLIGVSALVADYFGVALLLRAAAWKNTLDLQASRCPGAGPPP